MKKYVYVFFIALFITSVGYACLQMDKVKAYIKEMILDRVEGNSRDELNGEAGDEVELLLEVYDFMEQVEQGD